MSTKYHKMYEKLWSLNLPSSRKHFQEFPVQICKDRKYGAAATRATVLKIPSGGGGRDSSLLLDASGAVMNTCNTLITPNHRTPDLPWLLTPLFSILFNRHIFHYLQKTHSPAMLQRTNIFVFLQFILTQGLHVIDISILNIRLNIPKYHMEF